MQIMDEKKLREGHANYDDEIEIIEQLFEDFLILSKSNLVDYLENGRVTHSKKYLFSNVYKEIRFGGNYSKFELDYNYNRDESVYCIFIHSPSIFDTLVKTNFYNSVAIFYDDNIVQFSINQKLVDNIRNVSIGYSVVNRDVLLRSYYISYINKKGQR